MEDLLALMDEEFVEKLVKKIHVGDILPLAQNGCRAGLRQDEAKANQNRIERPIER